jgi:hypothetical protein
MRPTRRLADAEREQRREPDSERSATLNVTYVRTSVRTCVLASGYDDGSGAM